MSDDASAYGIEDEQTESDRYDINDAIEQDEYPGGVAEEDPQELDEEHTDDPEYE